MLQGILESQEPPCTAEFENMGFKNYNAGLVIRIIILLINVFLTGSSYVLAGSRDLLFLPLILTGTLVFQTAELILYLRRLSNEVARFINNLNQLDLSEKFDEKSVFMCMAFAANHSCGLLPWLN